MKDAVKITENTGIEIRKSDIEGVGVFAGRDFERGETVYAFPKGKTITSSEIAALAEEKKYLDRIGEDTFEVIKPPARFLNHSCNPNIEEKNRAGHALRDIKKGEELTIDYDKIAYLEKPFRCRCGGKNCRETVRGKR